MTETPETQPPSPEEFERQARSAIAHSEEMIAKDHELIKAARVRGDAEIAEARKQMDDEIHKARQRIKSARTSIAAWKRMLPRAQRTRKAAE